MTDIAILGSAVRVPGAATPSHLWHMLQAGTLGLAAIPADRIPGELRANPLYVPVVGLVEHSECFDGEFFGIGPRDAAVMDPQHRVFLECCWAALEDAALTPTTAGRVGVFASSGHNTYLLKNLLTNPALIDSMGWFLVRHTGNDKDFLATEVSYHLNLTGPSINVQTACSSSLVAVHLAAQSLLAEECDVALAGGVTIETNDQGYVFREGEILSNDGICRPFDNAATGTVFGSGAGVVVLKRLADAIRDGDPIDAVLRGTAVNNDGATKVGYLAPSVDGHAAVVEEALAVAGVDARTIGYLEAHGTGTVIGDPIEVAALTEAYRTHTADTGYCALGSVKANIGHLDTAAAVIGLVKTVYAVRDAIIPPLANFASINDAIPLATSPFRIPTAAEPWPADQYPRRAALSSLGVGGTNAHAIVEEPPARETVAADGDRLADPVIIAVSGRTPAAVERARNRLADHLADRLADHLEGLSGGAVDLRSIAATQFDGRVHQPYRRGVAATTVAEAIAGLRESAKPLRAASTGTPVCFLLPGAGPQYAGMGIGWAEASKPYRAMLERCANALAAGGRAELAAMVLGDAPAGAPVDIERASIALPYLAATEVALAEHLRSQGIVPSVLLGQSLGELVAACVAATITPEDLMTLAAVRGELLDRTGTDAQLAVVSAGDTDLAPLLARAATEGAGVSLAIVSSSDQCVVSGTGAAMAHFTGLLDASDIGYERVPLRAAPHSHLLDPVLGEWRAALEAVSWHPPQVPWISNLSGALITDAEATSPDYWVRQFRSTVQLHAAITTLLANEHVHIEVGPGLTLGALVRAGSATSAPSQAAPVIPGFPITRTAAGEIRHASQLLADAWAGGIDVATRIRDRHTGGRRIHLPTYPFERARHWIEPGTGHSYATLGPGGRDRAEIADLADWFTEPAWLRADLLPGSGAGALDGRVLLILADDRYGPALAQRLTGRGHQVVVVRRGDRYVERSAREFEIAPASRADHERLWGHLTAAGLRPDNVLHLWTLVALGGAGVLGAGGLGGFGGRPLRRTGRGGEVASVAARFDAESADAFLSVTHVLRMIDDGPGDRQSELTVIGAGIHQMGGDPATEPLRALLHGPVLVGPREIPLLGARVIDIELPTERRAPIAPVLDMLEAEVAAADAEQIVAWRRGRRFARRMVPAAVPSVGPDDLPALRDSGTYLVTGAFGGIGRALACHLAAPGRTIVLVGRPGGSGPGGDGVGSGGGGAGGREDVLTAELAALGANSVVVYADTAKPADVVAMWEQAVAAVGQIHGVFHLAGALDDALLQRKSDDQLLAVLRPKVLGALALEEATRTAELDFLVLFSSTSAFLGPPAQTDYTAANAVLDALAQSAEPPRRVLAVNWGIWRERGMTSSASRSGATSGSTAAVDTALVDNAVGTVVETAGVATAPAVTTRVAANDWRFREHRLRGGTAVLPGAAYLEFIDLALRVEADGPYELDHFQIDSPIVSDGTTPVQLTTTLCPSPLGWDAEVGVAGVVPAVSAAVRIVDRARPAPRILRRTSNSAIEQVLAGQRTFMEFGDRWNAVTELSIDEHGHAEAHLVLPNSFTDDAHTHPLHPALIDVGIGVGLLGCTGYRPDALHVPVFARRITVWDDLPLDLYVLARVSEGNAPERGWLACDLTFVAPDGAVCLEVEGLHLRRLDDPLAALTAGPGVVAVADAVDVAVTDVAADVALADVALADVVMPVATESPIFALARRAGVTAERGFAALDRVLASGRSGQVVISSLELSAVTSLLRADGGGEGEETPTVGRPELATPYRAPGTDVEQRLAVIWQDALGIGGVGMDDDFFELGGSSLMAVRLFSRIRTAFGVRLGLASLFEGPTIAKLGALLRSHGVDDTTAPATPTSSPSTTPSLSTTPSPSTTPPFRSTAATSPTVGTIPVTGANLASLVSIRGGGAAMPVVCVHGAGGNVVNFTGLARALPLEHPVFGLQARGIDGTAEPDPSFEAMAERYAAELDAAAMHGPVALVGYSGGGVTALEIAAIRRRAGLPDGPVVLLDTVHPPAMLRSQAAKMLNLVRNTRTLGPAAVYGTVKRSVDVKRGAAEPENYLDFGYGDTSRMGFVHLAKHFEAITAAYVAKRYDLGAELVTVTETDATLPPKHGWNGWLTGPLHVHRTAGNHRTMLSPQHVGDLAALITRIVSDRV